MFSLDKLKVYDKALANAASLAQQSRSWDKRLPKVRRSG